jgi:hypothetical protein
MTPAEALAAHIAQRPEMPRPFNADQPECIAWQRAMQRWVDKKDRLECAVSMEGVTIEFERQTPVVTPRADYIYLEPIGRKRKRPAWSGATREYNRQKARESRERRRAAIREALGEGGPR